MFPDFYLKIFYVSRSKIECQNAQKNLCSIITIRTLYYFLPENSEVSTSCEDGGCYAAAVFMQKAACDCSQAAFATL